MTFTAKQQLSRNPQNAGYATPIKTYPVPAVTNEDGTISVPAQPVYGIDPNHEPIDMYLAVRSILGGVPGGIGNAGGIGATGIQVTVPPGFRWELEQLSCDVTMTATVGNRILQCIVVGPDGVSVWQGAASAVVAAAQVGGYDCAFGAPLATPSTTIRRNRANTGNTNVQVRETSGIKHLAAGAYVRVYDSAVIDVADAAYLTLNVVQYPA